MSKTLTIGVLTSGGDAPGMNAAIAGVYSKATDIGAKVLGIKNGYVGLLNEDFIELTTEDAKNIVSLGGTILGTARCDEFKNEDVQRQAATICRKHQIDALIVIGGDGSFQGAVKLHKQGIGVIGIPATIDLDIGCTDYSLGFDTSVNAAMEAIDRIRDTSRAHSCFSVVEVMGRHAGYIAMWCGIACTASAIVIPEKEDSINVVENLKNAGLTNGVVVVAEGAATAEAIAKEIQDNLHIHTRVTVLGFLQRGGSPTCKDRVYGCAMGAHAVDLIAQNKLEHVVAVKHGDVTEVPMEHALIETKNISQKMVDLGFSLTKLS